MQSDIYRGVARAKEMEVRVLYSQCAFSRRFIDLTVGEKERDVFRQWTATISGEEEKEETGIWYLWKIDSSCVGCTCPVDVDVIPRARASPTRGKYVRERPAPLSY